jgi:hypothetical protein
MLFLVSKLAYHLDRTTPPLCSTPITGASTLIPVAPPLTGASVFLLVIFTTCRFPKHHQSVLHAFRSTAYELRSGRLYTGCRWVDEQISLPAHPARILRLRFRQRLRDFDASSDGLLSFLFSTPTCRLVQPTFAAVAHHHDLLDRSSTAWFGASFCTPTPRGLPSSTTTALRTRSLAVLIRVTPKSCPPVPRGA